MITKSLKSLIQIDFLYVLKICIGIKIFESTITIVKIVTIRKMWVGWPDINWIRVKIRKFTKLNISTKVSFQKLSPFIIWEGLLEKEQSKNGIL